MKLLNSNEIESVSGAWSLQDGLFDLDLHTIAGAIVGGKLAMNHFGAAWNTPVVIASAYLGYFAVSVVDGWDFHNIATGASALSA